MLAKKKTLALYKGASDTRTWKVREHQGTISTCLWLDKNLHCHALPKLEDLNRIVIYASLIFFIMCFCSLCASVFRVFIGQDLRAGANPFDMIGLLSSWCDSRTSPTQVRHIAKVQRGTMLQIGAHIPWNGAMVRMRRGVHPECRFYRTFLSLHKRTPAHRCARVFWSCMFCRISSDAWQ